MNIAFIIMLLGFSGLGYLTYEQWKSETTLRVKSISRAFVEKTLSQLVALVMLINGLDFLPDVKIIDTIAELLGFVSSNLDTGWTAVAQLISLITALYQLVVKNTGEAVTNGFVRLAMVKRVGVKNVMTVAEYAQSQAA